MELPEPFDCDVAYVSGTWVLTPTGELDLATAPVMELPAQLACTGLGEIALDLRGLSFVDSSGLRLLLRLMRAAERDRSRLRIVEPAAAIASIMRLAGLAEHVERVPALELVPERYAVIATDLDGIVTLWNADAEDLYGWSAAEVVGRPITELTVGPTDQSAATAIMDEVRRDGRWIGEFSVSGKDDSAFRAHVRESLTFDAEGRPTGLVGVSCRAERLAASLA
jgi:anti-anti-sigma factor